jgi:hypothetical protein
MNRNGERMVNRMESWEYDMSEKNTPGVVDVGHTTGDRPTASDIWDAAQRVYSGYPQLLNSVRILLAR